jgi:hypothetical protein
MDIVTLLVRAPIALMAAGLLALTAPPAGLIVYLAALYAAATLGLSVFAAVGIIVALFVAGYSCRRPWERAHARAEAAAQRMIAAL